MKFLSSRQPSQYLLVLQRTFPDRIGGTRSQYTDDILRRDLPQKDERHVREARFQFLKQRDSVVRRLPQGAPLQPEHVVSVRDGLHRPVQACFVVEGGSEYSPEKLSPIFVVALAASSPCATVGLASPVSEGR